MTTGLTKQIFRSLSYTQETEDKIKDIFRYKTLAGLQLLNLKSQEVTALILAYKKITEKKPIWRG